MVAFTELPDDTLRLIISKVATQAARHSEFLNILLTSRHMNYLGRHKEVLKGVSRNVFSVRPQSHPPELLAKCAKAGNIEARYFRGMVSSYIYGDEDRGLYDIKVAARDGHLDALYELSIFHFNRGRGDPEVRKVEERLAFRYGLRAAYGGHIPALRELGIRLISGECHTCNVEEGERFLVQATAREALFLKPPNAAVAEKEDLVTPETPTDGLNGSWLEKVPIGPGIRTHCFGWGVTQRRPHPANFYIGKYLEIHGSEGKRMCSLEGCCRWEKRTYEFEKCHKSDVYYCSRVCRSDDWVGHSSDCSSDEIWDLHNSSDENNSDDNSGAVENSDEIWDHHYSDDEYSDDESSGTGGNNAGENSGAGENDVRDDHREAQEEVQAVRESQGGRDPVQGGQRRGQGEEPDLSRVREDHREAQEEVEGVSLKVDEMQSKVEEEAVEVSE